MVYLYIFLSLHMTRVLGWVLIRFGEKWTWFYTTSSKDPSCFY